MLHIVTSKNSSEHILHTVLFFFLCNKHLLKKHLYRTKLTLLTLLDITLLYFLD